MITPHPLPPLDGWPCGQLHQESLEFVEENSQSPTLTVASAVVAEKDRVSPAPVSFPYPASGVCQRLVQKFKEQGLSHPWGRGVEASGKKTLDQCPWFPWKAPTVGPLLADVSHTFRHWIPGNFSENGCYLQFHLGTKGWALNKSNKW